MSAATSQQRPRASLAVRAQAATWLAALRGPNKTPELVARFEKWLAESDEHRVVWEQMTDGWDLAGGLKMNIPPLTGAAEHQARRARVLPAVAASLIVAALAAGFAVYHFRFAPVSTAIGERREITLEDGTRVALNTDTRIRVRYSTSSRQVTLDHGEALFEVAKQPERPFIVSVDTQQIRALGTSFLVRKDAQTGLAITLVAGKIAVGPEGDRLAAAATDRVLAPGERLTIPSGGTPTVDRPPVQQMTAWQRGEVVFDETPLPVAIAEMNRYGTSAIVVDGELPRGKAISGRFRAGDSAEFARGVARTYRLQLTETEHALRLSPLP